MLSKKFIFSFIFSFFATFIVGFFIWSAFVDFPGNFIKPVLAEINSKLFTASISFTDKNLNQNNNDNQEPQPEEVDLLSSPDVENQSPIIEINYEYQDFLDDIEEELDIIDQQINALDDEQNDQDQVVLPDESQIPDDQNLDEDLKDETENNPETTVCIGQININTSLAEDLDKITQIGPATAQKIILARPFYSLNDLLKVSGIGEATLQEIIEQGCAYVEPGLVPPVSGGGGSGGGGGGSIPVVYPKILISEVQISPIDERFVELYNPNNYEVNLTNWYIQRKTQTSDSWGSLVSSPKFEGKIIPANGYFLISRSDATAEIILDLTLTENNSLVLKNPDGDISDKLGFGLVEDYELSPTMNPEENKSIGRKVLPDNSEQDTDDNSADFELDAPTKKTQNITYVEPPPSTDTTPPEVSFSLESIQNELAFSINFTIVDSAVDTVSPSGVGSYIFHWQENGGDWQEDISISVDGSLTSVDFTRDFIGEDGKTYNFQVKATDVAGNISGWLPETPANTIINIPVVLKEVLINEIQIAGEIADDEFVELYNPNNIDIDISSFSLKKKTSSGTESNLVSSASFSGIITALGYFLIAPQDDTDGTPNYTGTAVPDLRYSGKSYSVASNNTVLLYDKDDNLQDKVGFGSAIDFETAPVLNPDDEKSIQRKNLGEDTGDNSQDFIIIDTPTPKG